MFALKDLFVATRRGRSYRALFFCGILFVRLTHSCLSERGEEFLPTLHFSLSAINTMLLRWLGGPCPCQLFNTYICILNNFIIPITNVRRAKDERGAGVMIQYARCAGREREGLNGSNGFNCHNRITEINWGLATHLDYRALSPGLCMFLKAP